MIEAGMCRKEFAQVVPLKNAAQFGLGIVVWWVVGVAFAYGDVDDKFLGHKYWAGDEWRGSVTPTFATVTGLVGISVLYIINGAIAERTQPIPYVLMAFFVMVFAWPVVVGWTWGGGFLDNLDTSFEDMGGAAVVHTFSGTFSLVGLLFLGPRTGAGLGKRRTDVPQFRFGNPAYICIGTLLYFIHLVFLNGVYANTILQRGQAMFTTWLSAGTCALVTTLLGTLRDWSIETHFITILRGFIAGAILVSGVSFHMEGWAAFTFAVIGGLIFFSSLWLEDYFGLDDVTKAVSVHLTMGLVGTFGVGLWDMDRGGFHGEDGMLLGSQLGGELTIAAWATVFAVAIFGVCWVLKVLRVPVDVELEGMNTCELTFKSFISRNSFSTQVQPSERHLEQHEVHESEAHFQGVTS